MTFPAPTNKFVVQGKNDTFNESNAAAATIVPGYVLMKGTTDDDVLINDGAHNPVGWAGYEQASPEFKPSNLATAYALNARVPVVSAKGCVVAATLATSQTIVRGDALITSTGSPGMVCKATQLGVASGATAMTSAAANGVTDITGSAPAIGTRIVGYAEQSVTTTGSTATILIRSEL